MTRAKLAMFFPNENLNESLNTLENLEKAAGGG